MSFITHLAKTSLNKIFKNLANDMGVEVGSVQLGIYYDKAGNQKYCGYKDMVREKDIELDDYVGASFDFSGGTEVIKTTIAQAGAGYAKELKAPISDIKIIMAYREKGLPAAALMNGGAKVRSIDIEKDFLR